MLFDDETDEEDVVIHDEDEEEGDPDIEGYVTFICLKQSSFIVAAKCSFFDTSL